MTTPPPAGQPPSTGNQREDAAQQAGTEAAVTIAAAEAAILAVMAATLGSVAAGALGAAAARRRVRTAISGALGGASKRLRAVFARAARAAGGGQLPDAPDQIAAAVLNAAQDAGAAFDAAMTAALGDKGGPFRPDQDAYREAAIRAMGMKLSRLARAQKVMDLLAGRGITGFTDKAGRRWELGSYAEMAVRTATSRLHLSNQLARMAAAGLDLVIVDNPAMEAACPLCRPWEGRVLSLTGQTAAGTLSAITDAHGVHRTSRVAGTLARAVAAGLLHPNCRHSLVPWADGHGAVATVGGKPRGYVVDGKPVNRSLPIGTPQQYEHSQDQRAHERAVRRAHARTLAAMTPQAKTKARARLAVLRDASRAHARQTGQLHLPHREKAGAAR